MTNYNSFDIDKSSLPEAPWPSFSEEEINKVADILASGKVNYWTGEEGKLFEKEFSKSVGCKYGVSVANGTLALDLALRSLNLKSRDEVIVSPRTFIASASSIALLGLLPVFADVDKDSGNITVDTIRKVITPNTRAILVVHLGGWPCDMEPIMKLAKKRGLYVIEDCAQCHGAYYNNKSCGSFGDISAWSFCQDKIMTTGGEGGMVTTNNKSLWEKCWSYKDHGKSYDKVYNTDHPAGFRWVHDSFGSNYRLTEIQAALGRIQLTKLYDWVKTRRNNANILIENLSDIFRIPVPDMEYKHSYYKFYAYVKPESKYSRDEIMNKLNAEGVFCQSGSCPEVYLEMAFQRTGMYPGSILPVAKELGETSLMFQVHPTLTDQHMYYLVSKVREICS